MSGKKVNILKQSVYYLGTFKILYKYNVVLKKYCHYKILLTWQCMYVTSWQKLISIIFNSMSGMTQ